MSRGRLVASLAIQECSVQQIFFELSCIFAVLVIFVPVFRLFFFFFSQNVFSNFTKTT